MKIKTMAAALMIALAAGGVQAVVAPPAIELGDLGPIEVYGYREVSSGSFSEIFNFNVVNPYNWVGGNIGNLPVGPLYNITGLSVTFYGVPNAGGLPLGSLTGASFYATTGLMSAGNYSIMVSGTATGSSGGIYTYAVVAVPEPETYAMFLAGLGLVGAIARRRRAS